MIEERQLGHRMSNVIGMGCRCKHGFPQAFAFDPVERGPWRGDSRQEQQVKTRKSSLESGLFRLSCPLLVKAIDEWEREGAVASINEEVRGSAEGRALLASKTPPARGGQGRQRASDLDNTVGRRAIKSSAASLAAERRRQAMRASEADNGDLAALLDDAHAGHAAARHAIIGEDRLPKLVEEAELKGGAEQLKILKMILNSGVAGQSRNKTDVKCVHAQMGDHLCRSRSNGLAARLMERLEARGTAVHGNDECVVQCDLGVPVEVAKAKWWYEPRKNKWKLRKRNARRKEKTHLAAKAREDLEAAEQQSRRSW